MKATSEKIENCQVSLNVEAEASELEESLDEAYHRLVGKVSVPGFRKGKAPRSVLEQHIGKDALLEEAIERLLPQLYQQAIQSEEIEPIAEPQLEVTQNEPLAFKAVVPVKPVVELGDYHSIKLQLETVEIGEAEVEEAIGRLREERAVLIPVDRAVQAGDFVIISIEASVDGKPFLNHKDVVYAVDSDSIFPLPGFAQQLLSAEKNEERVFRLEVPADYSIKEFCGGECLFKVKVGEVKEKQLPELDDAFAQSCNVDDLASLKGILMSDLAAGAEQRSRLELRRKAIEAVVNISEVDYPPVLEDREIDSLLKEELRRLGYPKVEDYLERAGKTREELREELRPIARKRVANSLVLDKMAEAEKIEVNPSEVDNRISELAGNTDNENKEKMQKFLDLPQVRESMIESLRTQKAMDYLVQVVSGNQEVEEEKRSEEE